MPVFFLEGLAGSFFRPLALSYVLAVVASLVVALTVTPALCLLLLPRDGDSQSGTPRCLAGLQGAGIAPWLPGRARPAAGRGRLAGGALRGHRRCATALLGEEFLPKFKEYDFLMHWVEKPGTSLEAMQRITVRASRELRAIPGVRNFGAHIGRAEVADEVVGPNFTELWISLDPRCPTTPTLAQIQEVVDGYPGLYRDVLTYLRERIKEVLTRRQRGHRRARLRAGPRACCGRRRADAREGVRRRRRRGRPPGRAAGAGARGAGRACARRRRCGSA